MRVSGYSSAGRSAACRRALVNHVPAVARSALSASARAHAPHVLDASACVVAAMVAGTLAIRSSRASSR